jgi:hypothetical protein
MMGFRAMRRLAATLAYPASGRYIRMDTYIMVDVQGMTPLHAGIQGRAAPVDRYKRKAHAVRRGPAWPFQ